jgi:hypothetical protein
MVKTRSKFLSEGELEAAAPPRHSREELLLGIALLTPPLAWSLHLALCYGLVYPAFDWQSKAAIYVVALLAAGLSLASAGLGFRALTKLSVEGTTDTAQGERRRFLAICACAGGIFFLLAVIAQSVPAVMLPLGKHG